MYTNHATIPEVYSLRGHMFWIAALAALMLSVSCFHGCASTGPQEPVLSPGQTVSVWRFQDVSYSADTQGTISTSYSGESATKAIVAALSKDGFRVVDYSRVAKLIRPDSAPDAGFPMARMTPQLLQKVREATGVEAIIFGHVTESVFNSRQIPEYTVAVAYEVMSTKTGTILANGNASGDGWNWEGTSQKMAAALLKKLQ